MKKWKNENNTNEHMGQIKKSKTMKQRTTKNKNEIMETNTNNKTL